MSKYEGVSLSSGYELEFDTIEEISEHIESNLLLLADIEEGNGNIDRENECLMSIDILQDYMEQYDCNNEAETVDNLNNFSELIQYEYEVAV